MKRPHIFALLFSSWIIGIALICLFPPVPDYDTIDGNSGCLSQDSFPEIHQRSVSQTAAFDLEFGVEFDDSFFDFKSELKLRFFSRVDSLNPLTQLSSRFNSLILFKAFFETW